MASTTATLRNLTQSDLPWVLDLSGARRERIVAFAPRFWRSAPQARQLQEAHLGGQIDDPHVVSLRADHGFLFAAPRGRVLDVDDMAVDDEARWPDDGHRLLQAASAHGVLRFVCPTPERERTQAALDLGMSVQEVWWHRDLPVAPDTKSPRERVVAVDGGVGHLVDAPPIYAPGGPVVLTRDAVDAAALAAIENLAVAHGATVSVVSQQPDDTERGDLLRTAGYQRTTNFFVSQANTDAVR